MKNIPYVFLVNSDGSDLTETEDDNITAGQKAPRVIAVLYAYNGSELERVQTDGSGNLKITL